MSPALSASARPKSSVNSDTERSQKIVSVSLLGALLLRRSSTAACRSRARPSTSRSVPASTRLPPMFSRAMSSGVLTVKNRKKVSEVDAEQDQHAVDDAADDVAEHRRQRPRRPALRRARSSRSRRRQRTAPARCQRRRAPQRQQRPAATSTGWFHSASLRARSSAHRAAGSGPGRGSDRAGLPLCTHC